MIRQFLIVSLCYLGLLSSSALSLNDYKSRDSEAIGQIESIVDHSFAWQNFLAEEEFEVETKPRHSTPFKNHFQSSSFRVEKVVSLGDGRVLAPSNALKVFSLYHQFF